MEIEFFKDRKMLALIFLGIALIIAGIIIGDAGVLGNLAIIAIFIWVVPIFLRRYLKFMRIKSIEDQFPNFVRDLADSKRSGMSFPEAIKIASRAGYGKLTPEIKKMNNRLSWGTPFLRVLDIFGKELKDSRIIGESLNIIRESHKSGGDVAATLDSVARDIVMLKDAEEERLSLVRQHVMIMYGIFFLFLGIAIMIIQVMVPMIKSTQTQASTATATTGTMMLKFSNPCETVDYFPCNLFSGVGVLLDMPEGIGLYYTALFFCIVIIQGIFTGLIAGQLGENSVIAGAKHSIIMVFIAIAIFLFLAKAGMFPV